jgi:hypothetical protein
MADLHFPFESASEEAMIENINSKVHMKLPGFSKEFIGLIDGMIQMTPERRLTIDQIIENPLIQPIIKLYLNSEKFIEAFKTSCENIVIYNEQTEESFAAELNPDQIELEYIEYLKKFD